MILNIKYNKPTFALAIVLHCQDHPKRLIMFIGDLHFKNNKLFQFPMLLLE